MTRHELIAALEAATGPATELDAEIIYLFIDPIRYDLERDDGDYTYVVDGQVFAVPKFTASIDAALTLVPGGWMVELWLAQPTETQRWDSNVVVYYERSRAVRAEGKTPAIALCIAALKARAHAD